jgi:hypothetical protein
MNRSHCSLIALLAISALLSVARPAACAGSLFTPRVPISAFGLPNWFDPANLHVTTSVSVGSSGWSGTNGLQVTTLSYSFKAPVAMSLSLGNTWGPGSLQGRQSFFLEGFNLAFKPSRSFLFQIQYQDLRSPLQLQPYGFSSSDRWGHWAP